MPEFQFACQVMDPFASGIVPDTISTKCFSGWLSYIFEENTSVLGKVQLSFSPTNDHWNVDKPSSDFDFTMLSGEYIAVK